MSSNIDLKEVYEFAKRLAKRAGDQTKAASQKRWQSSSNALKDEETKLNSVDVSLP